MKPLSDQGFTLIEMAVVMVVVGLLLKQFVVPLGAMREQRLRMSTESQMTLVVESLMGFTAANHRLPCPATLHSGGQELNQCNGGAAATGYVPTVTLGLMGATDGDGVLLDAWGSPYIYAVSASNTTDLGDTTHADFVTAGDMAAVGMKYLSADLLVCQNGLTDDCSRSEVQANQVPFVLVSLGSDTSRRGHQTGNQDGGRVFVSRAYSSAQELPFDDLVHWVSENRFFYQLIQAGVLP